MQRYAAGPDHERNVAWNDQIRLETPLDGDRDVGIGADVRRRQIDDELVDEGSDAFDALDDVFDEPFWFKFSPGRAGLRRLP